MTISTEQLRVQYPGNGSTNVFPIPFSHLETSDLLVTLVAADGTRTVLTPTTEYTSTGQGRATGTVVTTAAVPAGSDIVIVRRMTLLQPTDYRNQSRFFPETHERSFDRLTMQVQQIGDGLSLSLQAPPDNPDWFDAQGRRIINLGAPINAADATNRGWVEQYVDGQIDAVGGFRVPLSWAYTADGLASSFLIPGADIASAAAYTVTIDGIMQTPQADYAPDLSGADPRMQFVEIPPDGASILIRAMGYASAMTADDWDAEGNRIRNVGMAIQNGDAISYGFLQVFAQDYAALFHTHDASAIVSGVIPPERLGSGVRDDTRFLRDDGEWALPSAAPLPLSARGDLLTHNNIDPVRLPVGANGLVLIADSTEPTGLRWGSAGTSGAALTAQILSLRTPSSTISWIGSTLLHPQVIDGSITSVKLGDDAVLNAKLAANSVSTAKIQDGAVTSAKLASLSIGVGQIDADGTAGAGNFLRGDGEWSNSVADWTVTGTLTADIAASQITSGIVAGARLGAGWGAIDAGVRETYLLNADGDWVQLEALTDGTVVPVGSPFTPGPGGGVTLGQVQTIVVDMLQESTTIGITNTTNEILTPFVKASSIGLAHIDTASLDTRYALVGGAGGSLPAGGTTASFLRGDGTWSNTLVSGDAQAIVSAGGAILTVPQYSGSGPRVQGQFRAIRPGLGGNVFTLLDDGSADRRTQFIAFGPLDVTASGRFIIDGQGDSEIRSASSLRLRSNTTADGYVVIQGGSAPASTYGIELQSKTRITGGVDVVGGSINGPIHASNISSGLIDMQRLGDSPTADKWLRGNGTWDTLPSSAGLSEQDTDTIDLTISGGFISGIVVDGSIGQTQLANNGVTADKLATNAVTTEKIGNLQVTDAKLAANSVTNEKIATGAVTANNIQAGAVGLSALADNGVTPSKLFRDIGFGASPVESGQILSYFIDTGSGLDYFQWIDPPTGGGVPGGTYDGGSTTTIDTVVVGNVIRASVRANSIDTGFIADDAVTTEKLDEGAVTVPKIAAIGTPSASTYLRGDGAWATPPGGSGGSIDLGAPYPWTGEHSWVRVSGGRTDDFRIGQQPDQGLAQMRTFTRCAPTTDRAGAAYFRTRRDGGLPQNNILVGYEVTGQVPGAALGASTFDIGLSVVCTYNDLRQFGSATAGWFNVMSPQKGRLIPDTGTPQVWGSTGGVVFAAEFNYANRWEDFGLHEDRRAGSISWTGGIQMVPDTTGAFDGPATQQFHASFGIIFAASNTFGTATGHHISMYHEENSTAPHGYMHKWWGGSTVARRAGKLAKVQGWFDKGIDFTSASLNSTNQEAITLKEGQCIEFDGDPTVWSSTGAGQGAAGAVRLFAQGGRLYIVDSQSATPRVL